MFEKDPKKWLLHGNSMIGEWIGLAKNSQIPNPLGDNWIYNWPFGYLVADVGWQ